MGRNSSAATSAVIAPAIASLTAPQNRVRCPLALFGYVSVNPVRPLGESYP
jgi:hypothetical protein